MNDKQSILQLLKPVAVLRALTPEARNCVPQSNLEHEFVRIHAFPFKIGRESRTTDIRGGRARIERTKNSSQKADNDLYLVDSCELLHISRQHVRIEKNASGYQVADLLSACGTQVGETRIAGKKTGGEVSLKDGDIIAIGAENTPYLFEFITLDL